MAFKKVAFPVTVAASGQGYDDATLPIPASSARPARVDGFELDLSAAFGPVQSVTLLEVDSAGDFVRQVFFADAATLSAFPDVVFPREDVVDENGASIAGAVERLLLRSKYLRCIVDGTPADVVTVTLYYESAGDYRF